MFAARALKFTIVDCRNIIISGLRQLIKNKIIESDVMESHLIARTEEVRRFSVSNRVNLIVFPFINSDPIDTRRLLSDRGLRIPTVPEIIFFSQQNHEFAEILDGKWFRVNLGQNTPDEKNYIKNNWILRFCIDGPSKLYYNVEEDRKGITLKKVVGIDNSKGKEYSDFLDLHRD